MSYSPLKRLPLPAQQFMKQHWFATTLAAFLFGAAVTGSSVYFAAKSIADAADPKGAPGTKAGLGAGIPIGALSGFACAWGINKAMDAL